MNALGHAADAEAFASMAAETLGAAAAILAGTIQRDELVREASVQAAIALVHATLAAIPDPEPVDPMAGATPMPPPPVRTAPVVCTCQNLGAHNRGVFEKCLWTPKPTVGPGQ